MTPAMDDNSNLNSHLRSPVRGSMARSAPQSGAGSLRMPPLMKPTPAAGTGCFDGV